jgi:hypothetical protein
VVGEGTRLTRLLLAALLLATAVRAAAQPVWAVDGGCRDRQPHGRYELRDHGNLRAVGAFNHGKRTGSFIFWTVDGARVAHIPYDDDIRHGTLATWFAPRSAGGDPPRRFESSWRRGTRDGPTRSWYRDGRPRGESDYAHGQLIAAAAWLETGARVPERTARDIAARDAGIADALHAELEALVRTHLPHCD